MKCIIYRLKCQCMSDFEATTKCVVYTFNNVSVTLHFPLNLKASGTHRSIDTPFTEAHYLVRKNAHPCMLVPISEAFSVRCTIRRNMHDYAKSVLA